MPLTLEQIRARSFTPTIAFDELGGVGGGLIFVPPIAAGANKVYFDVWNLTGASVLLRSLMARPSGAVAVTGALSVDLYATRTTSIGTGGTAAVNESATLTDMVITTIDPSLAIPTGLTGRQSTGGGAAAGAIIGFGSVFTEETNAGTYLSESLLERPIVVASGTGFRVIQGSVASVGNTAFVASFSF